MAQTFMKAVRVHEYGGADALTFEEVNRPEPQGGEVLIRIVHAGVIPLDWKIRQGHLTAVFPQTLPYIPGFVVSGVVDAVGEGVTEFRPGDRVFGSIQGAYAEYSVAQAEWSHFSRLMRMPDNLTFADAATIIAGAESAWKALFTEGNLEAGQTVLIHAAAGGVGQFAVQLAKWKGATVIGTASSANLDFVQSLGADRVIDYTATSFEEIVKGVDLVVDAVGGDTQERSWSVLKRGGTLVSLVQPPAQEKAAQYGVTAKFNSAFPTRENVETIAQLIADGTIKAEVGPIYPLSAASEAHKHSERMRGRGRILLRMAD